MVCVVPSNPCPNSICLDEVIVMRTRKYSRTAVIKSVDRSLIYICLLAAFFLIGCLAGYRYSVFCIENSHAMIAGYLFDFCEVAQSTVLKGSFLRTVVLFFVYPVAVFLMGFSPLGVIMIPFSFLALGFGAVFAVQCFLCVFARIGIFPVMALFAIRMLVILTSVLFLSVEAFPQAWRIAQVTIKNRKHSEAIYHGKRYIVLALFCLIVLILGACCESVFSPILFRFALDRIL